MESVLDKELSTYFSQLSSTEKKSVLLLIKTLLNRTSVESKRINIEQYNKEIDDALAEVANGNYLSQDAVEKMAIKW